MSRLSALAAHPRRTISALAVVLAAVGITVGSGADFTARSANPSNTFSTGTLSIGNSASSAVLNAPNLKPGETGSGIVEIQNTGSVSGTFKLSTSNLVDTGTAKLLPQLDVKIEDCGLVTSTTPAGCAPGATPLYTGKASAIPSIGLGTFAGNAKHRYQVSVTLPQDTDNSFQGSNASLQFDWDATS